MSLRRLNTILAGKRLADLAQSLALCCQVNIVPRFLSLDHALDVP